MKRILSFGGGLQTTALAILVAQGKLQIDGAVFADTGAEKPETYWYIENYIKGIMPLTIVKKEGDNLFDFCWKKAIIPSVYQRRCTDKFKVRPILKYTGKDALMLIGFSLDENRRAKGKTGNKSFPLIERHITANGCRQIIRDFGFPLPLKSSCFFCPFTKVPEWNWLKNNHPDLFQKALDLEAKYHQRKPEMRDNFGLLNGTPLWRMKDGIQPEMFQLEERSCWSGQCGH